MCSGPYNVQLSLLILGLVRFFSMDETEDYFGLLIGRHISVVVVATSHGAARYGVTGKTQSA